MNNEFVALASAIDANGEAWPPSLTKLIEAAPDSFDDQRAGTVAATAHRMREAGEHVNFASVAEQLPKLCDFISSELNSAPVPISCVATYADEAWEQFTIRRAKAIGVELAQSLDSSPRQAQSIIAVARFALATITDQTTGLPDRLTARLYSPQVKLIEPETRFRLGSVPICTPANLTTLSAPAKAGKSAGVGAMIASTFASFEADCLGFTSKNPHNFAVVHIDTEQCPYDHQQGIERAVQRAGVKDAPDWLRSYCVTGFSAPDIRQSIRILLEDAKARFGGIHSVFIDGTADAAIDVNDPAESNAFVAELHDLAIRFDCPTINIIHVNPGSESKTRGHLGSQLERKSETNLRLEKDGDGVTVIFADKNRRAPIPKSSAPRFAWSDDQQMHIAVQSLRQSKEDLKREELLIIARDVFADRPSMRYADLKSTVKTRLGVSDSTAERRVITFSKLKIIKLTCAGLYVLST